MITPKNPSLELPRALATVHTRPLFAMRLDVRPMQVFGGAPGDPQRRIGVVFGGSFTGDRLSGDVLDGGADWQDVLAAGTITLDVRLVLRADDGALIGMTYRGRRHASPEITGRIERGEGVDPGSYYFRISPFFQTGAIPYRWLNHVAAVGIGHRDASGPLYNVFEVL